MGNETIKSFYEKTAELDYHPNSSITGLITRKGLRRFISFDDRFLEVKKTLEKIISEKHKEGFRPVQVLDVGCGDGVYEKIISDEARRLAVFDGIDISSTQEQNTKGLFSDFFKINIDQEAIPTESEKYDVVICSEILEHLFFPDHALEEVARVLKKNGSVVITIPNAAAFRNILMMALGDVRAVFYPREKEHIRFFNLRGIKEILSNANLRVTMVRGLGALLLEKFNFVCKIYTPRIIQVTINKLFPALCPGILLICQKNHESVHTS